VTVLLDSDWVVDFLNGTARAQRLLGTARREQLAVSAMTYGEVYEGIYFGRDPRGAERVFQNFLRSVDVLPISRQVLRRFARIRGELRRQSQLISDPDILIAATALHHGMQLATRNRQHFGRVAGLVLYVEA
jgi:predicted nucleic acid-binding protein